MTYYRNLVRCGIIFLVMTALSLSCDSDDNTGENTDFKTAARPEDQKQAATDTLVMALPAVGPPQPKTNKPKTRSGILRERGDFWIGLPHKKGSMLYLRLAANTEIKVLNLVEGYYEVAHRGIIGYLEQRLVEVIEEETVATASLATTSAPADLAAESIASPPPSTDMTATAEKEEKKAPAAPNSNPCTGAVGQEIFPGVSCVQYRSKVYEKVSTLENYIQRIIDKSEPNRQKSVDLACRLFVNEQARVYTSSLNEAGRSRPVRKYLNGLMMLNYDRVEIDWTNIQYVSELRKGPDGRYFGYVHIEQKFQGFMDGRLVYGDLTEKKITVVLEAYEIIDAAGDSNMRWDIFLSDIGVEQTQTI